MATSGDRSQKIRIKIQSALGDPEGKTLLAYPGNVYDSLNRVQNSILEQYSAGQQTSTISIVANTELYDLPSGFAGFAAIIPGSTTPLTELTMDQVADIKRAGTALDGTTTDPVYFYIWKDQVGFMNPAGGAPASASTVTLYNWGNVVNDASDTIDPTTNKRWDTALFYGSMADITGDPKWITRYELECKKQNTTEMAYRKQHYQIPVNRNYD